jgi:alanyl-tRNA synthetase
VTERLYYQDCYLREFRAHVVETEDDGRRVYLDRTAFYPTSGGQPFDTGTLGGVNVIEVIDEEERVAHVLDAAIAAGEVAGQIDWTRRFDHMQQHSGQHLLSAVLEELFKIPTVSFHLGTEVCTIDVTAASLAPRQVEQAEERCAEIVSQARRLGISFEDAAADLGLRKESQRTGTLRVVAIDGIDRSACGGTHVRTTAEIGPVAIRRTEKIRGNTRLEFVCGLRALRHARADFRTLQELSRQLSVPASETPALVATQLERVKALEKANQRMAAELAQREGRELWNATAPGADGIRRMVQHAAIDDAMRARAQAFTAEGKAAFLVVSQNPPAILMAASADSGIHAGDRVKAAVTAAGGRGGGNQGLAQGSLPAEADLNSIESGFTTGARTSD